MKESDYEIVTTLGIHPNDCGGYANIVREEDVIKIETHAGYAVIGVVEFIDHQEIGLSLEHEVQGDVTIRYEHISKITHFERPE